MPNALAVVAHHDDHILWMGGMIQRMKSIYRWNWTLIAMCVPAADRRAYFTRCSNALGVDSQSMVFDDYSEAPAFKSNPSDKMRNDLLGAVRANRLISYSRTAETKMANTDSMPIIAK
jgi:hypothetical protein